MTGGYPIENKLQEKGVLKMSIYKTIFGLFLAALLGACGGGGGSAGTTGSEAVNQAVAGSNPRSSITATALPEIRVSIIDSTQATVTTIGALGSYFAKAVLLDVAGIPIANKLVNFSLNSNFASLASKTALTDSNGIARVGISSTIGTSAGAATLDVNANVSNTALSASTDFSFSGTAITLPSFTAASTSLASGGNTTLSISANIDGTPAGAIPVNITLTASCGTINGAAGPIGITTTGAGIATASYSAVGADGTPCSGSVNLGASSVAASATPLTITIAPPVAASVVYVSSTLNSIYVAGAGAPMDSVLTFKVLTSIGSASPNTKVNFAIPIAPGGVSLSSTSGTTDISGLVTVKVTAGAIPGPLKVRASIESGAFAESQNLTVSSGPPSQRYMSVSVSTFNIEGANLDGVPATITARLADRQGNPVQDGTVVNFTASGGQVASSCATAKVNGIAECSVIWKSQNPHPANGRVAILAYAVGVKDYLDMNSDNSFNGSDTLVQMGDPFRDDDESGDYSAINDRFAIPLGGASGCAGSGEPVPAIANTCDANLATIVRRQVILMNASSIPLTPTFSITDNSTISFDLVSADHPNIPMPAGTSITAVVLSATNASCSIKSLLPSTVANIPPDSVPAAKVKSSHTISTSSCAAGDKIGITITSPSKRETTFEVTL
ncbi:MAG: hypothetical protein ORN28_08320 [Rhodoferax sp.]|nr:hypothetical protein [Rhodoferax sp.]